MWKFSESFYNFGLIFVKRGQIKKKNKMKNFTLLLLFSSIILGANAQNIDDNKVNFPYIQLPLQKVNPQFTTYEVRVNHLYTAANNDSLMVYNARQEAAKKTYDIQYATWLEQKKVLDKNYLAQMAQYEKAVNAGTVATMPANPIYPPVPLFTPLEKIKLHGEISDNDVSNAIVLEGFQKGLGGSIISINIHPIRSVKIIESKSGTGATTKYDYKCQYILPIEVAFETPTEGKLYQKILFDHVQNYSMKSYASKYEYQAWYIDNGDKFFAEMESSVRKSALSEINRILNNEFGFVKSSRGAELYSVKKYKDYDYKDVIEAYTLTTQAFTLVGKDRDRASAIPKIDLAIAKWLAILGESNTYDDKARINDKITAMIQCNLAELYVWKGDYDQAELYVNLALNAGVMKFRNHAERVQGFYNDQKMRWNIHY